MPEAKQYHHGDLKAAILARATEVIEDQGIEALSLRVIARDLGVSHGAPNRHFRTKADLLSGLATEGWAAITRVTLEAADAAEPQDAMNRLNAMGQGFLKWAIRNRSKFLAVTHPDVSRHADEELRKAMGMFQGAIQSAVVDAQQAGRRPEIDRVTLTLYTNSVPFGLAMLLLNPLHGRDIREEEVDGLVEELIELVVPTGRD